MGFFDGIANAVGKVAAAINPTTYVAPLIGAVGSFLGQNSANQSNKDLAQQANQFNAAQTKEQMDFQERMRATQYQTTVADLKAAGLNPMLAYTQGGAGNIAGSAASAAPPPRLESALGNAAQSAAVSAQAMNNVLTNRLIQAQTQKTDTEADNIQADTVNKLDQNPNIKLENKRMLSDIAFKDTAARLNSATAYNTERGIAPSPDPFWYRDAKRSISSAAGAFGIKIPTKR